MLFMVLIAQLSAASSSEPNGASDQDRVTATEVLDYAEWRTCALKATHKKARSAPDHEKVADMAMTACETKEGAYRSSLTALAQLYKLPDPADFAHRNGDEARAALRASMIKELK